MNNKNNLYSFSSIPIEYEGDYEFGCYGFRDENENIVIEPKYELVGTFSHGLCAVCHERKWQTSENGVFYDTVLWGYINTRGEDVIPPRFKEACEFNKFGVAVVSDGDACYLIDTDGNEIEGSRHYHFSRSYDYEDRYITFSDGPSAMSNSSGLYDTKDRRIKFEPFANLIEAITDDCFLVYDIALHSTLGLPVHFARIVNSKKEELYPEQTRRGFCNVEVPNEEGMSIVCLEEFRDAPEGRRMCYVSPRDGKRYVRVRLWGVINKTGDYVIRPEYTSIKPYDNSGLLFLCEKDGETHVIKVAV